MELTLKNTKSYRSMDESGIQTGNSTVYKAQDLEFRRTVCIKVINLKKENTNSKKAYEWAMNEVKGLVTASELTTHVPVIHDVYFEQKSSLLYIVMQWINGNTLEKRCSTGHIQPLDFLTYMEKLCSILEKLEPRKLYHKDIKPANIIITSDGEVFLVDFNLSISTPNQTEGTPDYKAPEMDLHSKTTARDKVDIFSIGVMMYQYFTGTIPVRGTHYAAPSRRSSPAAREWDHFVHPKELNSGLDSGLDELITKCMKLDPKQRFRNARDLKRTILSVKRNMRNENKRTREAK